MISPTPITFSQPDTSSWTLDSHVHVWRFPAVEKGFSLLTDAEKEIAGRFRFAGDRNRFAVGRHALRLLLSKYLLVTPDVISIIAQKGQKPFVNCPPCDIHFNISHSGDWVLIAFANRELGIDIEQINPDFEYDVMLREHFSDAEKTFISGSDNRISSFYYVWTRKEALIKARGRGLQENLKMTDTLKDFPDLNNNSWKLESFEFQESYHAAIAYSGELGNPIYFDGANML